MIETPIELLPAELPGRVCFEVSPAEAIVIGQRLRAAGISAVTCLDNGTTTIEVPADVTPEAIAAALRMEMVTGP